MKNVYGFCIAILLSGIILSCASGGSPGSEKAEKPAWITSQPSGSLYYIGIGGSNTGNQAEDKELARARALAQISSEIYASVESSLDINVTDSSEEGESHLIEQNIKQNVEQDLEALETMGTWYSEEDGYWYYLRLNKMEWESIQEKRAQDMIQRIEEMFSDIFRDTLSELKTIDRAYTDYKNNYTGRKVKIELFGQKGSIDTLLLIRAENLINGLNIPVVPFPSEMTQMQSVTFKGEIESAEGRNAGSLILNLSKDENHLLGQIPTNPDGSFEWLYRVGEEPGEVNYSLVLASPFENPALKAQLDYALPRVSSSVLINPLLVQLVLENEGTDKALYDRTLELLNRQTPFSLTNGASDKRIKLSFSYHEAPENDYGIIIAYGRCFIAQISKEGEAVLWQSTEEKSGGLTVEQARGKVADKLLSCLENNKELAGILEDITFF